MKKSFTRLLGLVMLFGFLTFHAAAQIPATALGDAKGVWPEGATAYTKTTDKALVIYSQDVVAFTGSIRVSNAAGLVQIIPANDPRVSFAKGDTVEIDLSGDLKELTEYAVTVDATAFKAADGSPAAFTNPTVWGWKTGDYTAPTLKSVVPIKGAIVDNQTTYTLELTFEDSDGIVKGTGDVIIYKADGNVWDLIKISQGTLVGGVLTYGGGATPLRPLEDNVNYYVTVAAGTVTDNGLRADSKKNSFAGQLDNTAWTFSTKDFSIPNFNSGYPKIANIGNTSADVVVSADEVGTAYAYVVTDGAAAPSAATIRAANQKVTVTVVNTEYTISLNATSLGSGLGSAGTSEEFDVYVMIENADVAAVDGDAVKKDLKTTENTAPLLTGVNYKKGDVSKATATVAGNVVSDAISATLPANSVDQTIDNIVITFSEKVKVGAGAVTIRKAADNSVFATIDAASLSVSSDVNVKIPVSGLQNNTKYYVQMPNTLILDVYNNAYSGMSATTAWDFFTNDIIAPTFTIVPADGASGVKKDANITITFNEIVTDAAGAFVIEEDGGPVTFALTESTNDGKFTSYVLNPDANFASEAVVVVKMIDGKITDGGGNAVAVQGEGTVFVVEDYEGPTITWDPVAGPAKPSDVAKLKFNEPIYLLGGGEITDANLYTALVVKATNASGANVAHTATISADKKTITITPSTPWVSESTYYIAITSDIQDASGNAFAGAVGDRSKTFTIADVTAATVDLSSVDGKTISTGDPVTLIFKEGAAIEARTSLYYNGVWNAYAAADMNKVIVLKEGSATGPDVAFTTTSADAATIAINASLVGNKTYYVGVGASTKGADGNVNVAKFVTFNTKFEGAPTKVSLSPADNAKEVALKADVIITFNTAIELVAETVYNNGLLSGIGAVYLNINGAGATVVPWTDLVVSGSTLKIKHADFLANNTVEVTIDNDVVLNKNTGANPFAGIAAGAWNFETIDKEFDVATLTPDNTTSVAIDAKLVLTFTEKAFIGTGYVDIINATTDAIVERINITSGQVAVSSDQLTVTITPSNDFSYNTPYYIEVTEGALVDWVGNKNAAIYGKTVGAAVTDWTFTISDPAISVVKVTPADGADKVANNASIVVEFNREVVAGSGSAGYIEVGTPDQLQAYPIGSSNITVSGKTITITHSDKVFPADTEIYIYLEDGAVKAKTNAAILSPLVDKTNGAYSFNTGDVNAPVATVTPGAYSVTKTYEPVETNITITFDENVYNAAGGTVLTNADVTSGGIFTVNDGTGNVDFIGTIVGKVVTLDPTSDLAENATVTVTVVDNKIEDVNGTTSGAQVFTFETVDKTLPVVSAVVVTGGDKQLGFAATVADLNNKEIYLLIKPKSEGATPTVAEVKAGVKKGSLAIPSANVTHTFTGLLASTTYEIFYVAVDSRGNTTAVAKAEGSTDDTIAPLLVSTDPANGAVDVNVTGTGAVEVKLTFNEDVVAGTGLITIRDYATQTQLMVIDQTALSGVVGDSKSLKLTIPGIAAITTDVLKFYVEIAAGAIKDVATVPNNYAGLFGMDALVLTTEDNMAPTVNVGGSTSGAIKLDADIKVAFSENVVGGSGSMVLYKTAVADANAIQVFYASNAVISGKTATVNPTADLENGVTYIMTVGAGFVKDLSSNANANAAGSSITFSGTTNPAPSVTVVPAGGSTAVVIGDLGTITATFDENIYLMVAGSLKPLTLLTQSELLANVQLVDGNGVVIPITLISKAGGTGLILDVDDTKLKHETSYTLTISGFMDADEQVMTTSVTNYTTSDGLAPSIVFNPAKGTKDVAVSTAMTLTFSENIYADVINTNDSVWAYVDNSNVETFVFLRTGGYAGTDVPFTAAISGKVITITPKAALESATRYYYGLKKTVEDINGQAITLGVEGTSQVYYDTKDIVVPVLGDVTASNFAPLGNGTSPTASMWVIFNEDVVVSTGSVVIRREDGTIFQTVSGSGLSIDGTNKAKLKIAHNPFEDVMNYFVELSASVVVDKSGNPNAAWSDAVDGWLFSTKDTRDLQIASLLPMGDNTPRSAELKINFDKAPVGVAGNYVAVYKEDGTAVYQIESTSMSVSGMTASISGIALDADQSYYARIEPKAFSDAYGNNFAGLMDNTWVFSTVDNIAPEVAILMPADNSSTVDPATSFSMTFNRDIVLGTGMIAIRLAADGTLVEEVDVTTATVSGATLSWDLAANLTPNTAYYVIVPAGAVTNTEITADPFAGILNTYTWNFTTGDVVIVPELVTWTPIDTIADNHPTFEMTFAADVMLGAIGNLTVTEQGSTEAALTIEITADMIANNVVTVSYVYDTLVGGLKTNTTYIVNVDGGVLVNAEGNAWEGISDATTWTFTTGPDWATAVKPVASVDFKVYPNPFNDHINIDNSEKLVRVMIVNIAGQRVLDVEYPERQIRTANLISGVYLVNLFTEKGLVKTDRIIKR